MMIMKRLIVLSALLFGLFLPAPLLAAPADPGGGAASPVSGPAAEACKGANLTEAGAACDDTGLKTVFGTIVNVLLFVVGFISIVMIIVGAVRFVTSGGNEDAAKSARATILYAVVGLAVALLALAIVNFVLHAFETGTVTDTEDKAKTEETPRE